MQMCLGNDEVDQQNWWWATSPQSKHWSGNCRVCQTSFTSLVREKRMRKRNLSKIISSSSSNFKSLRKEWGGPGRPSLSASDGHAWIWNESHVLNTTDHMIQYRLFCCHGKAVPLSRLTSTNKVYSLLAQLYMHPPFPLLADEVQI